MDLHRHCPSSMCVCVRGMLSGLVTSLDFGGSTLVEMNHAISEHLEIFGAFGAFGIEATISFCVMNPNMKVAIVMGLPQELDDLSWNIPIFKWMMTGGTLVLGHLQM